MWDEGPKTDRAVELLRLCAAKTDADGNVIPTYRYSRSFKHAAEHLKDIGWGAQSEVVTIESTRGSVKVLLSVTEHDGTYWEQHGEAGLSDDSYDWYALATCRALLNYAHDDGEPMTEDEVIAMFEEQRQRLLASAERSRKQD